MSIIEGYIAREKGSFAYSVCSCCNNDHEINLKALIKH